MPQKVQMIRANGGTLGQMVNLLNTKLAAEDVLNARNIRFTYSNRNSIRFAAFVTITRNVP